MDRFVEMQAFTEVVRTGAFVRAAVALEVSKAAISRHVADLESRLGVQLIQRTTRKLALTEDGQRFYEQCTRLLGELRSAEAEVMTRSVEISGTLRISAPLTFGILYLALAWGAFKKIHPKVSMQITLGDRIVDLVNDGQDIAIRIARLPDSNLISKRIAQTRMVVCSSPEYLRAHGVPQHPADLASHAVISYSNWASGNEWAFEGPAGVVTVTVAPCMETNNGDTCRAAALAGEGIILQPAFLVGNDVRAKRLVELMPRYTSPTLGIYIVYPSRRHLPPRVRAMIDFLTEHFRKPRWPN
jgi:DNA-binding transcriptional LysR family regulator